MFETILKMFIVFRQIFRDSRKKWHVLSEQFLKKVVSSPISWPNHILFEKKMILYRLFIKNSI